MSFLERCSGFDDRVRKNQPPPRPWEAVPRRKRCPSSNNALYARMSNLRNLYPKHKRVRTPDEFKASTKNLMVARAPEQSGEPLMIEAQHELAKSDTKHARTSVPDRETPCQGRTDEPEKNDPKPPKVSHETALTILTHWLLLAAACCLLAAACWLPAADFVPPGAAAYCLLAPCC